MSIYFNMLELKRPEEEKARPFALFATQPKSITQQATRASEDFSNGFTYFFGMHRQLEAGNLYDAEWRLRWSIDYFKKCRDTLKLIASEMKDEPFVIGEENENDHKIIRDFERHLEDAELPQPQTGRELITLAITFLSNFLSRLTQIRMQIIMEKIEILQSASWDAVSLQKAAIFVSVLGRLAVRRAPGEDLA